MMQQDYTRKTQEVAESRKAVEQYKAETEAQLRHQAETFQQFTSDIAEIHALDAQIKPYAELSQEQWQQWAKQDWMAADAAWKGMQLLERKRGEAVTRFQQKQNEARQESEKRSREAQQAQQQHLAKRHEETLQFLQREVPGWDEKLAGKVSEFAVKSMGLTRDELIQSAANPKAMKLLYLAWRGDQLETQQKAAAQKAKSATQPKAKPLTPVGKGRPAPATNGLSDSLSMDEWMKRRNKQLRS
jgi:hypothetical protein